MKVAAVLANIIEALVFGVSGFLVWNRYSALQPGKFVAFGLFLFAAAAFLLISLRLLEVFPTPVVYMIVYMMSFVQCAGFALVLYGVWSMLEPNDCAEETRTPRPASVTIIGNLMMASAGITFLFVLFLAVVLDVGTQIHPLLTIGALSTAVSLAIGYGLKVGSSSARVIFFLFAPMSILVAVFMTGFSGASIPGVLGFGVGAYFLTRPDVNAYFPSSGEASAMTGV